MRLTIALCSPWTVPQEYRPVRNESWVGLNPLSSFMRALAVLFQTFGIENTTAMQEEYLRTMKALLDLGADPNNIEVNSGMAPLVAIPRQEFALFLLHNGLDIHNMHNSDTGQYLPYYFSVFHPNMQGKKMTLSLLNGSNILF